MEREQFTFQDAYKIQTKNLVKWAKLLNTQSYILLIDEVIKRNSKGYKLPDDVCRGNDISSIVDNLYRN